MTDAGVSDFDEESSHDSSSFETKPWLELRKKRAMCGLILLLFHHNTFHEYRKRGKRGDGEGVVGEVSTTADVMDAKSCHWRQDGRG